MFLAKSQTILQLAIATTKVHHVWGNSLVLALLSVQGKVAKEGLKKIIICLTTNEFPIKATPNEISLTSSALSYS